MAELTIRRNRGFTVPQYQGVSKTEKTAGSTQSRAAARTTVTVSETLQQLMSRVSQAENHTRESRRTLQTGEGVLAEVKDNLDKIAQLAQRAAGGGTADRAALQAELERLGEEIDRIVSGASAGDTPLFLDGEAEDGMEPLLYSVMNELSAGEEGVQSLPDWLVKGIVQNTLTPEQILTGLGLDKTASASELLAALTNSSLENNSAAGYLAALYLGAVIAGNSSGTVRAEDALDGLRQLLETVSGGVSLDKAIELLTGGKFTSLMDFQEQFMSGSIPGLKDFLADLLLAGDPSLVLPESSLLTLLDSLEGMNLDLLMGLFAASQGEGAELEASAGTGQAAETAAEAGQTAGQAGASHGTAVQQFGTFQVTGQDLSGVSFHSETGVLTVGGSQDVVVQGTGQEPQTVVVSGSGTVTLQNVSGATLVIEASAARIASAGENQLGELQMKEGTSLTLEGGGLLRIGLLRGGETNILHLTGGAVVVKEGEEEETRTLNLPVVVEGAASLAAQGVHVANSSGAKLESFDILWKTLLPGWSSITAMELDGKQARMALLEGDPARLWLEKWDPSHGNPLHRLIIQGKDQSGRPQTRYTYLHWSQETGLFQEISMYPNPFTITGGEQGKDWVYEEESHTLCILSAQVAAISGGSGTDTNQTPFSGRIALADRIGGMELALGGVVCRVPSGRAFDLGRENDVTLFLQDGTRNFFESGTGYAGISLGEGTSLRISCPDAQEGSGSLTAAGTAGGAGIGRDSGPSRDQASGITICGGVVTATGTGGGAGIGAGKQGFMGPVTILGGTVTATGGKGGGAGIGGALGAPVGDITIQGGKVTAVATHHAAAIGAGVQGECGDILIAGTARIVKALGGNPGADIGACLFGGCGKVLIAGAADIGRAQLWTRTGIPLQMGEDTVTLPQFRLSARALQLDRLRISTPEQAQAAQVTVDADRRWVSQIQGVYQALYHQLEQSFSGLYSFQQYMNVPQTLVRDTAAANTLLEDMRRTILLQPSQAMQTHSKRGREDVRQLFQ